MRVSTSVPTEVPIGCYQQHADNRIEFRLFPSQG